MRAGDGGVTTRGALAGVLASGVGAWRVVARVVDGWALPAAVPAAAARVDVLLPAPVLFAATRPGAVPVAAGTLGTLLVPGTGAAALDVSAVDAAAPAAFDFVDRVRRFVTAGRGATAGTATGEEAPAAMARTAGRSAGSSLLLTAVDGGFSIMPSSTC
jgi:hypothetical protein